MEIRMSEENSMTQEMAEECAEEIVNKAVAYGKIKPNIKNIWKGEILDYWILQNGKQEFLPESERVYYNLFQHSKIIDEIPSLNINNGIASLMGLLVKVDNSRIKKITINKQVEGPGLKGLELRNEWKREFNTMQVQQKNDKCSRWLTSGCPKKSIPPFVFEYIKTLGDTLKEKMREDFTVGQDKVGYWNKNLSSGFLITKLKI
jgi:hypothetical protein